MEPLSDFEVKLFWFLQAVSIEQVKTGNKLKAVSFAWKSTDAGWN